MHYKCNDRRPGPSEYDGSVRHNIVAPGADGNNPKAPNAASYDGAKANPYPNLPDPLTLNNGQKVTTPQMWWKQRRPEIVEDMEREMYGRLPKNIPHVTWTVKV